MGATRDKSTYPTGFRGPHLHQMTLYSNPKLGKRQPCSDFFRLENDSPHCKYWYHPKILGGKRKTNITYVSINMYMCIHTFICTLFKVYKTNVRWYLKILFIYYIYISIYQKMYVSLLKFVWWFFSCTPSRGTISLQSTWGWIRNFPYLFCGKQHIIMHF